jgi:hypothetical protein
MIHLVRRSSDEEIGWAQAKLTGTFRDASELHAHLVWKPLHEKLISFTTEFAKYMSHPTCLITCGQLKTEEKNRK